MAGKPLRTLTSLLLTAIILGGGGGVPSFSHSHIGGDHSHCHHAQPARHHAQPAGKSLEPRANGLQTDKNLSFLAEAGVAHVHFYCLGFGFSFPLDSAQQNHQPTSFLAFERSLPIVTAALLPAETTPTGSEPCCLAEIGLAPLVVGAERQIHTASSQRSALPLCAKARRERTGVQLI